MAPHLHPPPPEESPCRSGESRHSPPAEATRASPHPLRGQGEQIMAVYGQDWSAFQPGKPSTSGLSFAIVKATEGHTYTSPVQAEQAAHARAAGLVVGFYH